MAFGYNGSLSRTTAQSVLLGCLILGVLVGLSPINPIDRASSTAPAGGRTTNLREGAAANVVAPAAVATAVVKTATEPKADAVAEDKSGLDWPASRKMVEDAEGDGFAEGQGAWGPDNEEMEDWVDLWGGVDLVGAVNDADILTEAESYTFSYDI